MPPPNSAWAGLLSAFYTHGLIGALLSRFAAGDPGFTSENLTPVSTLAKIRDRSENVLTHGRASDPHYDFRRAPDDSADCGGGPWATNFMKSDSASRDGYTSPPSPKNRQKLMISGRQRIDMLCAAVTTIRQ